MLKSLDIIYEVSMNVSSVVRSYINSKNFFRIFLFFKQITYAYIKKIYIYIFFLFYFFYIDSFINLDLYFFFHFAVRSIRVRWSIQRRR